MYRVQANNQKNWLYFRITGNIDTRESRHVLDVIIKSLERLQPGFDIISDISDYTPLSQSADINISSLFRTVKEHGVRKTINIDNNPNSDTSFSAKIFIDELGFRNYENASSFEEAERLLEN